MNSRYCGNLHFRPLDLLDTFLYNIFQQPKE